MGTLSISVESVIPARTRRGVLSKEEALQSLRSIPPFPGAARKLMGMVGADAADIRKISDVLKSDAVLAGETLRVANSALFALRNEVTSVMHAVSVLGLDRLKAVVLTVGLRDLMKVPTAASQRCWRHNLACALIAEHLAPACALDRSNAYTAGLLHGIGFVAFATCFAAEWELISEAYAARPEVPLLDLEAEFLSINHLDAADWLMRYWELPPTFLTTSRCDHQIAAPIGEGDLSELVRGACEGADWLGFGVLPRPQGEAPDQWNKETYLGLFGPGPAERLAANIDSVPETVPYKINDFEMTFLR